MAKKLPKGWSGTAPPKPQQAPGLSLFAIDAELSLIQSLVNETGGETTEEMDRYYQQLLAMGAKKCDGYIATIIHVEGQIEAGKEILKKATDRLKRWVNIADSLRDRLAIYMDNQKIEKLKPDNPVLPVAYLNKGKRKLEIDDKLLPDSHVVKSEVRKPDKEGIEKALARGEEVPGVMVTTGDPYVVIR